MFSGIRIGFGAVLVALHAAVALHGAIGPQAVDAARTFWNSQAAHTSADFKKQLDQSLEALSTDDWSAQGPHCLSKALTAVALTAKGRTLVRSLAPLIHEKKLEIFTVRSGKVPGVRPGLAGVYFSGRIGIDDEMPLLFVVGALFHELVHAQDFLVSRQGAEHAAHVDRATAFAYEFQPKADAGTMTEADWARYRALKAKVIPGMMRTEWHAYAEQNGFFAEMIGLDAAIDKVLREGVQNGWTPAYPIRTPDLRTIFADPKFFGMDAVLVDAFLKENPLED